MDELTAKLTKRESVKKDRGKYMDLCLQILFQFIRQRDRQTDRQREVYGLSVYKFSFNILDRQKRQTE